MKTLLTGSTGRVGRQTVARLVRNGHRVRVIGRKPESAVIGAEYVSCDVSDYPKLRELTRGMEGVVHLAALAHPTAGPGQEIFRISCAGTFNVYHAAAEETDH
jgi:nucleoside-diphosphate-sugar epimerase